MFWNNSRTFYNSSEALGSFDFLPLRGAGTGFVVVLPLPLIFDPPLYILHFTIHYISQRTDVENCFRITGLQRQVQTITRAILPRNQSPGVSNSQRRRSCEQIFDSSTTFLNPLVGTNSSYGKQTVVFFAPSSHALRACEACALRAHNTLTPRFTDFFTDFEKKPTFLQSTIRQTIYYFF